MAALLADLDEPERVAIAVTISAPVRGNQRQGRA
jgi:hypothetical protein